MLFLVLSLIQIPAAILTTVVAEALYGGLFPSFGHALPVILGLSVVITSIPNGVMCKHLILLNSEIEDDE
jgi:hypothetical protein